MPLEKHYQGLSSGNNVRRFVRPCERSMVSGSSEDRVTRKKKFVLGFFWFTR